MAKQKTNTDVQIRRKDLSDIMGRYESISDAIAGEHAVKAKNERYLPVPSSCKNGTYDKRYKAYQTRAVYYNVCQPTRDALVGQIFLRPPVIEMPDELEFLIEDMNGEKLTFEQLARKAANHVLPFGRGGLLTDFPITDKQVTKAQLQTGEVRPIVRFFEPWAIRNWRVEKIGTTQKLTLLVLDEAVEKANGNNEFDIGTVIHQRVYRLRKHSDGEYCCSVQVYDEDGEPVEKYDICGRSGDPLNEIPFDVIGSENNDMDIDEPPFTGLANLNLAHFRNSADYEESAFLVGQPTPFYSGMTDDWMQNYFPDGIPFGSGASVTGPPGSVAELMQAQPNSLAYEAMTHKEDQMFSIGAKIINRDQKIEKKEKEVEIEAASQKSVLTNIKNNLQMALFKSIQRAASFIGVEVTEENSKLQLNENFDLTSMSPQEMQALSLLYNDNQISFSEMREGLRRSGIAKLDDEAAKTAIMADKPMKESLQPKEPEPTVGKDSKQKPQN